MFKYLFVAFALFLGQGTTPGQEVSHDSIVSGGGASVGGRFEVSGTIGQPVAGGALTGGSFVLSGGFWPKVQAAAGDCNINGVVDLSDFGALSVCLSEAKPNCECSDFNSDGKVDLVDFALFQTVFSSLLAP